MLWLTRLLFQVNTGVIPNHLPPEGDLRKALVDRDLELSYLTCQRLCAGGEVTKFIYDNGSDLAEWCTKSKRVFNISQSLAEMLIETELPDFPSNEVRFVNESFVIQIEEPIKMSNGRSHDFILCCYSSATHSLSIRSYPASYENYVALQQDQRKVIEKDARKKSRRFDRAVNRINKQSEDRFIVGYTCFVGHSHSLREAVFDNAPEDEKEEWDFLFHLALGVNLYIQSTRTEDTETVRIAPNCNKTRSGKTSFTAETQIFELSTSSVFSRKNQTSNSPEGPFGSIRPHFRRGYWRRPPGYGNDPEAFATIWVRPTMVHRDKVETGERPIGSIQTT